VVEVPGTAGDKGDPGTNGTDGVNSFTVTTADFTVPAVSATVTVLVADSSWMAIGQNVFIQGAGNFSVTAKPASTSATLTYLAYQGNTNTGNNITAGATVSPSGTQQGITDPLPIANGGTNAATVSAALTNLGLGTAPLSVFAAGTAYQLTNTSALLDFGTTDPSLTISAPGTYLICAHVRLDYNAATFAAVRTMTAKLRRTNNTAADLTGGSQQAKTQIITTLTYTAREFTIIVPYVTANSDDLIQIWGDVDTVPTAGSLDAVEASIVAVKLFDQTL
jgi:hypothetical protein